jgi:predicted nucleotidyltransferase/HEPN domain-containing protein
VLPRLAELGLAEQSQSPPAVLYALVREHVAAEPLMALSELDDALMRRLGERISQLEHPPVAVAVYGSFARRQARADSDIDVLVVRPTGTDEEDERWRSTVGQIRATARRLSGNRVEIMEVAQDEVRDVVHSSRPLWQSIAREARLVHGTSLEELYAAMARAKRTKPVTLADARRYLAKGEEFLAVAEDCLAAERYIAATGNAVHAAINAADAVLGARTRQRPAAQDHGQALDLLGQAGRDGKDLAKHLDRLLPLKAKAEYDPDDVPRTTAAKAVGSARRAVAVARRVLPPELGTTPGS